MSTLAVVTTASAQSQNPKLVITEQSSTVLTVTLDGAPFGKALSSFSDFWVWDTGIVGTTTSGTNFWKEPDSSTLFNTVGATVLSQGSHTGILIIFSDLFLGPGVTGGLPNGAEGFSLRIFDGPNVVFGPVDVSFVDNGDVLSPVPDSSQTLRLLLMSSTALFGVARFYRLRAKSH